MLDYPALQCENVPCAHPLDQYIVVTGFRTRKNPHLLLLNPV